MAAQVLLDAGHHRGRVAARLLMAATPPVWGFMLSSPWMVWTTGRRAEAVALMLRTVWLISPAFRLVSLTVPSKLAAAPMTWSSWPGGARPQPGSPRPCGPSR